MEDKGFNFLEKVIDYTRQKIQNEKEKPNNLTVKEQKFCDYYLQNGNATESAKKSGYSEKTAAAIGFELLRKPKIKKYIDEQRQKLHNESIAKADEILRFWSDVLRCEDIPLNFRLKASEYLGKGLNLFDGTNAKQEQGKDKLKEIVNALNGYVERECKGANYDNN